jgi:uncharacterized protein DUF3106
VKAALLVVRSCGVALSLSVATLRAQEPAVPRASNGDSLPPDNGDKTQAEQKLNDAWGKLSMEDKMALMRFHHAMRDLPPEQRKMVRERIGRLLSMSPAERDQLQKNLKKWQQMTPQERQKAREEFRRHKQVLEEKWRREHPGEEPPPPKN